ncbi:hypothetical protein [Pseudoxanthomonas mexicana]
MNNQALEITYHIRGFGQIVYKPTPEWPDCIFEQDANFDVMLSIAERGLTAETDFDSLLMLTDARVRQLVLAWEFQYGRRLQLIRGNATLPSFPQEGGSATITSGVAISDRVEAEVVLAPPPPTMPQVPLGAERWIRTFAEAGDFSDYPEEQLRRHYLIIEELWDAYASRFESVDQTTSKEIGLVRHFVSHAECNSEQVVQFISEHLPSAIVSGRSRPTVRFDRLSVEHRNFVGRRVPDSERIARRLIELAFADQPPFT